MDLEPGWEKKALIVLGIITFIVVIYAFNPFAGKPNIQVDNGTPVAPVAPQPVVTPNNTIVNNTTNGTDNSTGVFRITAEQAKQIAAIPGYTTGEPVKGTKPINNVVTNVWIVPLMKDNKLAKNVYVDASTGVKVLIEELN